MPHVHIALGVCYELLPFKMVLKVHQILLLLKTPFDEGALSLVVVVVLHSFGPVPVVDSDQLGQGPLFVGQVFAKCCLLDELHFTLPRICRLVIVIDLIRLRNVVLVVTREDLVNNFHTHLCFLNQLFFATHL